MGPLAEKQGKAKKTYEKLSLPRLKYGLTITLSTKGLVLEGREEEHSEMIVTLEHEGCEAKNLFEHLEDPLIKKHLLSTKPSEENKLTLFQEAFFDIGVYIHVPKNEEATVDLTRTITSKTWKGHILIVTEENTKLTFIDKYHGETELHALGVEVIAGKNSTINYISIQSLPTTAFDIATYRTKTEQDSNVNWFLASIGSKLTHTTTDNYLTGNGSNNKTYGVFLGTGDQQFDLAASTYHQANNTTSDMYTRGVLNDKTKGVYRGNIDIDKEAYNCNGYQTEETLLISKEAVADAIPNLEIRNNEVKCSHGATIGRIDEEQLFYLTSRGINEKQATNMIVEGYFEPVTKKYGMPELFALIQPLTKEKLS